MTTNRVLIPSAMLIMLSLSPVQARVNTAGNATVVDEAKQTLKQLEASAALVETEASELKTFDANPQISSDSHLVTLMSLKSEINKMGKEIGVLDSERESLAPWEQQAIGKAMPLLKDAATNTESAIEYFNNNKNHLWLNVNQNYADRVWQDSEKMEKTLRDYLKYAKTHEQERDLEDSLGGVHGN